MPNDAQDRAAEWLSAGSASCDEGHRTFVAALQHKLETASWKRGNRRQQELAAWAFPDRAGSRPGGVQWLPKWAPESKGSTPESSNKLLLLLCYLGLTWWIPRGVASQKNRSVAGDIARCAPQHTFRPGKEPTKQCLGGLRQARPAGACPNNPSPSGLRSRVFIGRATGICPSPTRAPGLVPTRIAAPVASSLTEVATRWRG
jgi:hypothetical protein